MAIPLDTSSAVAIFVVLLVSISDLPWSTSEALSQDCHAPEVTEDQTGMMIFYIDRMVNFSSDRFFANLIRSHEPDWDILNCDQPNGTSHVSCKINSPKYKYRGVEDHKLTVSIPNITQHYADTYVFQVYINGIARPPVFCSVSVKTRYKGDCPADKWKCSHNHCIFARWRCDGKADCEDRSDEANCGGTDTKEGHTVTNLIAVVVPLLIIVSIGFVVTGYLLKRNASRNTSGPADKSEMGLMSSNTDSTLDNYEGKRWYWPEANEEDDIQLVENFWKNGPGAFFVRPSKNNPGSFVLVASFDGTVQHLTLVKNTEGVTCPRTEASFKTMCQVVKHYRENTIIVAGRLWGTLSKPFGRAPEENWYYGRLAVEYEDDVLLSSGRESGSFLIADAFTDTDAYYLIVNIERRIHRFGIAPNDVGFKMVDADLSHKTLTELVDYYKHNDIVTTGGKNFGKLSTPCPKKPDVKWFSETLTIDEEMKILQSRRKRPGSFLVSKGVTNPNKYVLAVYFGDELKRFTVNKEGNWFKLQNSERLFYSWYELVDYYREHDIEVRDNMFGKLSRPLRKEPEESCYIGRKTRMEERDLLLAGTAASGDFLIRDGITDPEAYVLAVNFHGHINHFDIYRENGGFRFDDTGEHFTTLGELVSFYKNTEITVGELTFGKLVKEVGR